MTISLKNRNIYDISNISEKLYGLPKTLLQTAKSFDLSYNRIISLQRPFLIQNNNKTNNNKNVDNNNNENENNNTNNSAFYNMTSLRYLLLSHNQLNSLVGASVSLVVLIAQHNDLESTEGLQHCTALRYVDLRHNKIKNLKGLPVLKMDKNINENSHNTSREERPRGSVVRVIGGHSPNNNNNNNTIVTDESVVHTFIPNQNQNQMKVPPLREDGLTLLLSFNEIKGASLKSLLSVTPFLIFLDISHNKIESMEPILAVTKRIHQNEFLLEEINVSYNPFLINGYFYDFANQNNNKNNENNNNNNCINAVWSAEKMIQVENKLGNQFSREPFKNLANHIASQFFNEITKNENEKEEKNVKVDFSGGEDIIVDLLTHSQNDNNNNNNNNNTLFTTPPPSWAPPIGLEKSQLSTMNIQNINNNNNNVPSLLFSTNQTILQEGLSASPVVRARTASPDQDNNNNNNVTFSNIQNISSIPSLTDDARSSSVGFAVLQRNNNNNNRSGASSAQSSRCMTPREQTLVPTTTSPNNNNNNNNKNYNKQVQLELSVCREENKILKKSNHELEKKIKQQASVIHQQEKNALMWREELKREQQMKKEMKLNYEKCRTENKMLKERLKLMEEQLLRSKPQ